MTITKDMIIKEIDTLPEPMLRKVYEFIKKLKMVKNTDKEELLFLAETSFAEDWLDEEEDERWSKLWKEI